MSPNPSPRSKASKGTIQIRNVRNRLRLLFSYGGKRHSIALELSDTPLNRLKAQQKSFEVQRDIAYGEFDPTYRKYKPQLSLSLEDASVHVLHTTQAVSLKELWSQYVEVRKVGKSPSTIRMYQWVANHLERCPYNSPNDTQAIFDWFTVNISHNSAKRVLMQVNACCNWAKELGKLEVSPFQGMASKIVLLKKDEEEDVNPFSRQERDRIIIAFEENRYYWYYASLVRFLFYTGCRPSEALALMWKTVGQDQIKFEQALVYDGHQYVLTPRLKTQKYRFFPVNSQLFKVLQSIRPTNCRPDQLVFPSPHQKFIDWGNFTNRAWKKILLTLPDIEYRNPYQTRHTFCSLCREAGIASIQIAKWVGNSAEMIDRVYAKLIDLVQVPSF